MTCQCRACRRFHVEGACPAGPPPAMHPMDPRRGDNLSPMFTAFLSWLLGLEPMTSPAITDIAVSGNSVLAATDENPLFDTNEIRPFLLQVTH